MSAATTVDGPRPLRGGAVMGAAGRIGIAVTGALTTIAIARLLGPSGAGGYFVGQSVILLLTAATTFGVEHGILYFVSSGAWGPRAAYGAALKLAGLLGVAGASVAVGVRLLVPSAFAGLSVWLTAVVVASLPFVLAWYYATYVA